MKQVQKLGKNNHIGAIGEAIAKKYLKQQGFTILEQNYLKKWGEIDLVARETDPAKQALRFVEVKTVSYETKQSLEIAVSRGTWRPEENVHRQKIQRINRSIQSWLTEHTTYANWEWQIDIVAVRIVPREKYATVKFIPNVIYE